MNSKQWMTFACVCLVGGAIVAAVTQKSTAPNNEADAQLIAVDQLAAVNQSETGVADNNAAPANKKISGNEGLSPIERKLPVFQLTALDESVWTAEDLKGKPWVINFWATWCPPCIEEIPSMNAAYEILKPQGIGMLAINAGEGAQAVTDFLNKVDIDFPNVLGGHNTLQNWSVRGLPTTIVVNANGDVLFEALGPREWDDPDLLQKVVDLL